MRFDIFTLFPEIFAGVFDESIIQRAREARLVEIALHDIRTYTTDKHHVTDDYPYAGGGGMVMKPEPIFAAVEAVLGLEVGNLKLEDGSAPPSPTSNLQPPTSNFQLPTPIILLTPQGRVFDQAIARELARHARLALICGHYEGVDERVREHLATDEISIGDYVLTGGEIPAMVIVDAVTRRFPARWVTRARRRTIRTRPACWKVRTIRAPPSFAAGACRTFCFPATTRRTLRGGGANRCGVRSSDGKSC